MTYQVLLDKIDAAMDALVAGELSPPAARALAALAEQAVALLQHLEIRPAQHEAERICTSLERLLGSEYK